MRGSFFQPTSTADPPCLSRLGSWGEHTYVCDMMWFALVILLQKERRRRLCSRGCGLLSMTHKTGEHGLKFCPVTTFFQGPAYPKTSTVVPRQRSVDKSWVGAIALAYEYLKYGSYLSLFLPLGHRMIFRNDFAQLQTARRNKTFSPSHVLSVIISFAAAAEAAAIVGSLLVSVKVANLSLSCWQVCT